MANPHPNTSGLRPFNQMSPEDAKYIQRLGGLSHSKRNSLISDSAWKMKSVMRQEQKKYKAFYDPEIDIYEYLCKVYYDPYADIKERIKAKRLIDSILQKDAKRIDEKNALMYKTASREYQLSPNFVNGFIEGADAIQDTEEDNEASRISIEQALKECREYRENEESVQ